MIERDHLIRVAREEMQKHSFAALADDPRAVVQCGKGHTAPSCPVCKGKFHSLNQFIEHLLSDVLPVIVDRAGAD